MARSGTIVNFWLAMAVVATLGAGVAQAQEIAPPAVTEPAPIEAPAVDAAPAIAPAPAVESVVPVAPIAVEHEDAAMAHDLSPWGMYMAADNVVKGVMIGLLLASIATWTVWLAKTLEIWGAKGRIKRAVRTLQAATSLAAASAAMGKRRGAGATLIHAAEQEVARAEKVIDFANNSGLKERVSSRLHRIEAAAGRRLTLGTGILATIGSVSPFVGLFGTVWGIMNSFIGIAQAQSSSLAVVAPGIAEALLATAMGLVAAIPAVVFYNAFARSITGYRQLLADASASIERLVSSDLDHRYVARNHPSVALAAE